MNSQILEASAQSSLHKPKAKWSPDEDQVLLGLIQEHGAHHWNQLAEAIPGRTGKQCRERWLSKLSPDFTLIPWTPEEDQTLIRCQSIQGNQWARFRSELPNRSVVQIKNRWVSLTRRGFACKSDQKFASFPEPELTRPIMISDHLPSEYDFGGSSFDFLPFDGISVMTDQGIWTF
jgi:hypothetical protein